MPSRYGVAETWTLADGETVLREAVIDGQVVELDRRLERRSAWRHIILFGGGAVMMIAALVVQFADGRVPLSTMEWIVFGGGATAAAVFAIVNLRSMPSAKSALPARYLFTNLRIMLLDSANRLIDAITGSEIESVCIDENDVVRVSRDEEDVIPYFWLRGIDDHEDVCEFVRETYT